jgi:hypothetical protein
MRRDLTADVHICIRALVFALPVAIAQPGGHAIAADLIGVMLAAHRAKRGCRKCPKSHCRESGSCSRSRSGVRNL